ncbi:MAG: hypothetical protein RRC07_14345 [Anaerolineae bacterium]|nr:hypothetical protein [Anaerolineae bacterium]
MNRSVINGEVEYHLRRQEQERARHHHEVPEPEIEKVRPGLLARLLAALKRDRTQRPPLDWERAGRRVPNVK